MKLLFTILCCFVLTTNGLSQSSLTWNVNENLDAAPHKYTDSFTVKYLQVASRKVFIGDSLVSPSSVCKSDTATITVTCISQKCSISFCDKKFQFLDVSATTLQLKSVNNSNVKDVKLLNIKIIFEKPAAALTPHTVVTNSALVVSDQQVPYYDALILLQGSNEGKAAVLKKYKYLLPGKNPFLQNVSLNSLQAGELSRPQKSLFSALGGLDVTTFADGLAKFIVKRAKEELTITFFENFRKEIENNKDMNTLFPLTSATLQLIGKEIYNYEHYLATLRENFESDFNALPDHVTGIIENHEAFFSDKPELTVGIKVGSKVAAGLRDKDHPGTILASVDAKSLDVLSADRTTLPRAFTLVQVLSESLREVDNGTNYWIDADKLANLNKDLQLKKYFIGLTLEMINQRDPDLYQILIGFGADAAKYQPIIEEFSGNVKRINSLIANNKNGEKVGLETVSSYVSAVTGLFETTTKGIALLKPEEKEHSKLNKILPWVKQSNLLVSNVAQEKYGSALFNLIELYKLSLSKGNIDSSQVGNKWLVKYGTFMAAMISAENSDQVAAVIETYALPSGSARIKKLSKFNIAVNTYLGLYGGWSNKIKGSVGITAPVGASFNWGSKDQHSHSIFASLIDIGAVTAFRFKNDTSEVAKIYLKEIISPGLFYSWGIKGVPISLNAGGQFTPYLQKVGATSNDYGLSQNFRFSLALVVDIPLLNIYNKTRD